MKLRKITLLILCAFLLLSSVYRTSAQIDEASESGQPEDVIEPTPIIAPKSAINLSVSPPNLFLETRPGEVVETTVRVFNNGKEPEVLSPSLMTFSAKSNGSSPQLREFSPEDEYQNWITISPSQFTLEPQKWQTLTVTFSPPPTAGLSYYYALVINRKGSVLTTEGETPIIAAPAILLLTKVKTAYEKQELQLLSFASKRRVYEYLPAEFEVEIKNTGNIHLAPVGNIFIDDSKKNDVGLIELNRTLGVVLPNSSRTYTLNWNDGFPHYENESLDGAELKDEKGNPKKKLKWDFSQADKFRFGKYSAHLVFIYDNGERDVPTEAVVSFWVIPWKMLALLGTIILLALLGFLVPIILLLRRRKK